MFDIYVRHVLVGRVCFRYCTWCWLHHSMQLLYMTACT